MKLLFLIILLTVTACSSAIHAPQENDQLIISEKNPNKWTSFTRQNLLQLNSIYDLTPILHTKIISIQPKVQSIPFPTLTLNTRYAENPKNLLSALIYEELFWWKKKQRHNFQKANKELHKFFPKLSQSNRDIILICYLEFEALEHYLGRKEAVQIIQFKMRKEKIRPWFYGQILVKEKSIEQVVAKFSLSPIFDFKN